MKVLTLRTAKNLPAPYAAKIAAGEPFYVRIAGEVTECKTLHDAQKATAYCPQSATVTLQLQRDAN